MKKQSNIDIDELKKHSEEWKNKYIRVLADYQNLEKRTNERIHSVRQFAGEIILSHLLPVVDALSKVKEHLNDPGLDLVYKELLTVLKEQGVDRIETLGKQFDPIEMDCMEVVNGKDNIVIEEVVPGYRFRGKILRVSGVKVGKLEPTSN